MIRAVQCKHCAVKMLEIARAFIASQHISEMPNIVVSVDLSACFVSKSNYTLQFLYLYDTLR